MKIIDVLSKETVAIGLKAANKQDLLKKMVDLAANSNKIPNKTAVLQSVLERENIMSTGVGKGVALPHAKSNLIDNAVASIALLAEPIDFESLDGEPINVCFLLLGIENNVGLHLRMLSKVSRFLNNDVFREKVLACSTSEELLSLFEEAEED